jgi:hypothetical protein
MRRGEATDEPILELEVTGELWYWRGPAPHVFVTVPEELAAPVHAIAPLVTYGWGMIPARVRLGDSTWETALWPKDGRYIVPIKVAVRRAHGLAPGDTVAVRLSIHA